MKTAPVHHPGFTAKLRNGRGRGRNIRRTSQFHNWAINRTAVGLALCPVCVLVVARRRLCDSSVFRALRTDNGIQAKQRSRNCHPRHDGATRSGALNWGLPPSFHHHTKPLRHRECGLNGRDRARGESAFFLFVVLVAAASFGAGSACPPPREREPRGRCG